MTDENKEQEEQAPGAFKVSDRRLFTESGDLREDRPEEGKPAVDPGKEPSFAPSGEPGGAQDDRESGGPFDFSSFLFSLATTGMIHLGEIPDPTTQKRSENLAAAKQMIDILTMLQNKTKGNLTSEENQLLENLLYELRMSYLNKSKVVKSE